MYDNVQGGAREEQTVTFMLNKNVLTLVNTDIRKNHKQTEKAMGVKNSTAAFSHAIVSSSSP